MKSSFLHLPVPNFKGFSTISESKNLSFPSSTSLSQRPPPPSPSLPSSETIFCGKQSVRRGKQRYPSEKKKLERQFKDLNNVENKEEGYWRFYKLAVPVQKDPGKDHIGISDGLLEAVAKALKFPVASLLPHEAFSVVRKSFDARKVLKEPKFVYTVDMDTQKLLSLQPRAQDFVSRLEPKAGVVEHFSTEKDSGDLISILNGYTATNVSGVPANGTRAVSSNSLHKFQGGKKPKIAVVGSGPSGLFASLVLAELGADVTLIERGQAVEQRGRDIGALVVRRILQPESNICFGEGGAGTWSDGKLVTRIGRNSDSVQAVMKTLVQFGAPPNILVDGKPHLGTDRLIPLLRNFRQHLQNLGVDIMFGTRLDDLLVVNSRVVGVEVSNPRSDLGNGKRKLEYDDVILAVGHSARDVYKMLLLHNVDLKTKDFSVGLRIEHPQELINSLQYNSLASEVHQGRGRVPVADYKLVKYVDGNAITTAGGLDERRRSCYSFCMCPGGQVVLTSTDPSELCINGMSFSRRASRWANAALVVTVSQNDFTDLGCYGPLAGVKFQKEIERKAASMGGGNFVVPVQTVPDFLDGRLSAPLPSSSYRLGVKASNLHELFPLHITEALQRSIALFNEEMPGFVTKDALLHGVETRTSSPVQVPRCNDTYECLSLKGLYPIGEGAGFAGGIVSAAVDGLYCGFAVAKHHNLYEGDIEAILGKVHKETGFVKY
ncbi:uncharacterized protein LOC116251329 isoform X2 [Nymphaea colorata]|uniref:uncharacterized protein LOC116251329 isoform X2 n=1 Tax=Nymphaea colorata TaxID=210225 RepID=UPI00129E623D|nr:uncharacterized protein LOC116251329 isoform X2 [Nymphaea colorata]